MPAITKSSVWTEPYAYLIRNFLDLIFRTQQKTSTKVSYILTDFNTKFVI